MALASSKLSTDPYPQDETVLTFEELVPVLVEQEVFEFYWDSDLARFFLLVNCFSYLHRLNLPRLSLYRLKWSCHCLWLYLLELELEHTYFHPLMLAT